MNEWQHIPEYVHPIAFTVGFFALHWYALFWLAGFLVALTCALWLVRQKGTITQGDITDLFFVLFVGAFFGGRLGYVFLYRPDIFLIDPLQIVLPFDRATAVWTGIAGMSFHGGLLGGMLALFFFTKKRKLSFWGVADIVALSAPIALFFGRVGNFWNQELPGRMTTVPWGMYFPTILPSGALRHPSSLYEALLEGGVLLIVLFIARRRIPFPGGVAALFLVLYGCMRFFVEYVREPDWGVSLLWGLTRGQLLSLPMIGVGMFLLWWLHQKNHDKMIRD